MVKKKMQGCHINTRSLTRLKRRLDIEDTYPQTIQSASEKVEEAWKHYKETKAKGDTLHLGYRERLARARTEEGNHSAIMELNAMNLRERQRDSARKIKYVTGQLQGVSTSHVEVADEQGNTTEITAKQELEAAIIRENEAKFHQTEDCPLLNGQLLLDIGLLGDGPQV